MCSHDAALPGDNPDDTACRSGGRPDADAPVDFAVDLTSHEMLRRAHVLDALGPEWDPVAVLHSEAAAYDLLYSGLSEEQRRLYEDLVSAGVLPGGGGGRAAS